ncbi:MAG: linear amide C-N hydrolase [Rhodobacteraceae bacterium]|nr:linear amide C-N hydrolase [Paracoccaceae bacterium]
MYDIATVDGMNEAGLAGNVLYLAEADYGNAAASGKPLMSIAAWLQYVLDNFATVDEAVTALLAEPFAIIARPCPTDTQRPGICRSPTRRETARSSSILTARSSSITTAPTR